MKILEITIAEDKPTLTYTINGFGRVAVAVILKVRTWYGGVLYKHATPTGEFFLHDMIYADWYGKEFDTEIIKQINNFLFRKTIEGYFNGNKESKASTDLSR